MFCSGAFLSAGMILKSNLSLDIRYNGTEIINGNFKSGNITKVDLKVVDLLDPNYFQNQFRKPFAGCSGEGSQVLLLKSPNDSPEAIYNTNDSRKHLKNDTELFVPYVFAVKNALLNRDGGIFDAQHFFQRGGCADFAW